MRFVRATWTLRLFVAVALLSLLPSLLAPAAWMSRHVGSDFGDWLRTQLREEPSPAFEAAISRAMAAAPRTLEEFLAEFVQAYGDPGALVHAFTGAVIQADDLLDLLSERYGRLVGDALVPDVVLKAAPMRAALADRSFRALLVRDAGVLTVAFRHALSQALEAAVLVLPRRLLTDLQPLGP